MPVCISNPTMMPVSHPTLSPTSSPTLDSGEISHPMPPLYTRTSNSIWSQSLYHFSFFNLESPLVILYSFDTSDVSGTSVSNSGSGGSSYTATLMNGASISPEDYVIGSGAVSLNASSSQYVQIPSLTIGAGGLSFACWFRSSGSGNWARIFDFGNGESSDNIVIAIHDNYLAFSVYFGSILASQSSTTMYANDNVWRHVVWTLDPRGVWAVYLNGGLLLTQYASYPNTVSRASNSLGRSNWAYDAYLNGAVDEFRVYDKVLSANDALDLYNGLVHFYIFLYQQCN